MKNQLVATFKSKRKSENVIYKNNRQSKRLPLKSLIEREVCASSNSSRQLYSEYCWKLLLFLKKNLKESLPGSDDIGCFRSNDLNRRASERRRRRKKKSKFDIKQFFFQKFTISKLASLLAIQLHFPN